MEHVSDDYLCLAFGEKFIFLMLEIRIEIHLPHASITGCIFCYFYLGNIFSQQFQRGAVIGGPAKIQDLCTPIIMTELEKRWEIRFNENFGCQSNSIRTTYFATQVPYVTLSGGSKLRVRIHTFDHQCIPFYFAEKSCFLPRAYFVDCLYMRQEIFI